MDMTFIHTLEQAITDAYTSYRAKTEQQQRPPEAIQFYEIDRFSKQLAIDLYFQLDASTLIDLAIYKINNIVR